MSRNRLRGRYRLFITALWIAACFTAVSGLQGCKLPWPGLQKEDFKTEYQAVLLTGGIVYFGKIEKVGSYIEMTDAYYIQNRQNPETKEIQSILVKRGKEWHGPDRMYLNAAQVIMIEPVAPGSQVGKMIQELKAKTP